MSRFLFTVDELVALVRARATLTEQGLQEHADTLGDMLAESALDVSMAE